jgi:hypothetical protein
VSVRTRVTTRLYSLLLSGGKASGSKQHEDEDTAADAALLALHLTHREATLLFAMAARRGATDSQIADALRQAFPHLSDPDYLQDTGAGQQSEEKTDKDNGKHAAHQGKKRRTTVQAALPQPPWLAADAFAAALGAIPANDWWRTWAAGRTIMLRMTSKPVKNAVDKLRPPAIVRLSRAFLANEVCCKRERLLHILTALEKMTSRCRITILDLKNCGMSGQDAGRLAGVLAQRPALSELYLKGNQLGAQGAGTEYCRSAQRCLFWILEAIRSEIKQQEAFRSAAAVPSAVSPEAWTQSDRT